MSLTPQERERAIVLIAAVERALAAHDATPVEALAVLIAVAVPMAGRCGATVEQFADMARHVAIVGAMGTKGVRP